MINPHVQAVMALQAELGMAAVRALVPSGYEPERVHHEISDTESGSDDSEGFRQVRAQRRANRNALWRAWLDKARKPARAAAHDVWTWPLERRVTKARECAPCPYLSGSPCLKPPALPHAAYLAAVTHSRVGARTCCAGGY